MEDENQIKDEFNKEGQESSTREYGANKENEANDSFKNPPNPPVSSTGQALLQGGNKKRSPKRFLKMAGLFVVLVFAWFAVVQYIAADKYEAQVLVIEGEGKVGVNPTAERLDFGDLSGNTSAARYVTLQAGGADAYIYVWKFGSIAELIKISENNFTMKKDDEKKLEFILYMPPSAPVGEKYTGRVWIFKVPKVF